MSLLAGNLYVKNKKNLFFMLGSWLFFLFALWFQSFSGRFLKFYSTTPVTDLLHDLLPLIDLNWLVTYCYLLVCAFLVIYVFVKHQKIFPAVLVTLSILMILRSITIHFTHIGAAAVRIDDHMFLLDGAFYYVNDLFFSGHVGFILLGFFMLPKDNMRWFFLVSSICLAVGLLLMRLHYTIDIFAAPFIAYGVYVLCKNYLWKYLELS